MNRPLEGKVVLVTGAGVRLGRAIALGLAQDGATLAVHFHQSSDEAEQTVAAVSVDGNRARAFQADLSRADASEALVAAVEEQLGPIRALVNSAAIFERADLVDTSSDLLDRQWAINARGPY